MKNAITTIENAGKYLVKSRGLYKAVSTLSAVQASHSSDPDLQAFAVLSVLIARVTGAKDDGWVKTICDNLGMGGALKNAMVFLVLTAASVAMGQDIKHAPTTEQCRADIAVWKPESKAVVAALPYITLEQREKEMGDCNSVLWDVQDRDGAWWASDMRAVYVRRELERSNHFINRHGLGQQFIDEDAKGAR